MQNAKAFIESYGYKLVTRAEFEAATDRPQGLLERANQYPGAFVVYDPNDDYEGWMLIGDDAEKLAQESADDIRAHSDEPEDGGVLDEGDGQRRDFGASQSELDAEG